MAAEAHLVIICNQPTLLRGRGTAFDGPGFEVGGTISLPSINGKTHSSRIQEIRGAEELVLNTPFEGQDAILQLTSKRNLESGGPDRDFEGCIFRVAPHVDQTQVYDAVFKRLDAGGCIGIFPEGGSHDRPDLLPLKAGVAMMALGALALNPNCNLKIVPCGMNYFHAHKCRSRAVIEFGNPIEIPAKLVHQYKTRKRREAVSTLLETIYQSLVNVTVISPDYETLMLAQAVRCLYNPTEKRLPLSRVVEINRRLVKGYSQYQNDPRMKQLKESVKKYNEQLRLLGINDHQVEYARFSIVQVVSTLFFRVGKISILAIGTVPGLVLFAPVFIVSKVYSHRKSKQDLKASTVKLQGHDVMASWKVLISVAFAPLLYALYTIVLTYWFYHNRIQGCAPEWIAEKVPIWILILLELALFISITFAALLIGEVGMDILKSLRPLVLCLNPTSANTLARL
ncbi:putative acyltransferase [Lachnellula subtilissima]|uniref:Putative acyltransferase n=1 Tax=Lachnellula subtilissima TaxID=602034 RepID=A0A8H8U7R7_9HELO|nr:putative acyltransferase [Lachnellula subtilissima]